MDKKPRENLVHHIPPIASLPDLEDLTDQQLLQRYIDQQDELAFDEVVRRYGIMVWSICKRILVHRQDAEDVYQATFLKLVRSATFVQQCESVGGWLHMVARNTAFDAKEKCDRQRAREKTTGKIPDKICGLKGKKGDLVDNIDEQLTYLSEKLRYPLILCYLQGLTHEQAAEQLHVSTHCLKRRLAKARHELLWRLSEKSISDEKRVM